MKDCTKDRVEEKRLKEKKQRISLSDPLIDEVSSTGTLHIVKGKEGRGGLVVLYTIM